METKSETIQQRLFALQDPAYQAFQRKLMPTVDPETVIGVRTPQLRKLAKVFAKEVEAETFLRELPHRYYEENNLHAFMIETIKDYDQCLQTLEAFLPYVDNWATCDSMKPAAFKKHLPALLERCKVWLCSKETYTVRFGIEMLMNEFLDEHFDPAYPALVAAVRSEEYYVNMMIAWYFATALAKQYDAVIPYIEQHRLAQWTHNKAIQKAIESYRITDAQKAYLRTLKWK